MVWREPFLSIQQPLDRPGLSHFMILRYLLSSLFSRVVCPTRAEYFLPELGEPPLKRERTTNNVKSWNGTALGQTTARVTKWFFTQTLQKFCTGTFRILQKSMVPYKFQILFIIQYVMFWNMPTNTNVPFKERMLILISLK